VPAIALGAWVAAYSLYARSKVASLSAAPTFAFSAENEALRGVPHPGRFVVIGDSRVARWSPPPSAQGLQFVMRGIGGETMTQLEHRFAVDAIALAPAGIVVLSGVNDIVAATYVDPIARSEILDGVVQRVGRLARMAERIGVCLHVMTVPPPSLPTLGRQLVWSDATYKLVERLNERLAGLDLSNAQVLAHGLGVVEGGALDKRFAVDTLHLSLEAYTRLNAVVQKAAARQDGPSCGRKGSG